MGRPPSGKTLREVEVKFYLTPEDATWFAKIADDLGFVSRASFFTAIMERLRIGGLAPVTFFRVGWQIAKLAHQAGTSKGAGFVNPFEPLPELELREKPRPEPALPDEGLAGQETNAALRYLKKELTST